jgi:PAS domain-containing protein
MILAAAPAREGHEAALKPEAVFLCVTERSPALIAVLSHEGRIRYRNPALRGVLGFEPGALIARSVRSPPARPLAPGYRSWPRSGARSVRSGSSIPRRRFHRECGTSALGTMRWSPAASIPPVAVNSSRSGSLRSR